MTPLTRKRRVKRIMYAQFNRRGEMCSLPYPDHKTATAWAKMGVVRPVTVTWTLPAKPKRKKK